MDTARPSNFNSQTQATDGGSADPSPSMASRLRTRSDQARSSSTSKALSSDRMGTRWVTSANVARPAGATRCVGESGVTRSGYSASSALSSLRSAS